MGSLGVTGRLAWRTLGRARRRPPAVVPSRSGTVVGVYRARNRHLVQRFVDPLLAGGWAVRLWALDEQAPGLEVHTEGTGAGTRTALLNRLAAGARGPVLVCDDDVAFIEPVDRFLALVEAFDLDLAQPAVTWSSEFTQPITACRPWALARRTDFVEIGPVVFVGERARDVVFPMDESASMGWGLELDWRDAMLDGRIRGGIVDATPVLHLGAVGGDYGRADELALLRQRLADRGLRSLRQVQHTLETYWRVPG